MLYSARQFQARPVLTNSGLPATHSMPVHATLARLPFGPKAFVKQNFHWANALSDTPSRAWTLGLKSDRVSASAMRMKRGSPKSWGCSIRTLQLSLLNKEQA